MSGQLRIRIRHQNIVGAWFDYLLVSQKEMKAILAGTGWELAEDYSRQRAGLYGDHYKDEKR